MDWKKVDRLVKEKCGNQILQIVLERIRTDPELTGISDLRRQGKPLNCSIDCNDENPVADATRTATRSSLRQRNKRPMKYTDFVAGDDDADGSRDSDSSTGIKISKPKKSRRKSKSVKFEKSKSRSKTINNSTTSKPIKNLRSEEPLLCDFCQNKFEFTSVSRLETHIMRYHVADKPFECEFCYRTYISKKKLKIHILRSHQRESETSSFYRCSFRSCNSRTFRSKIELKQHYEISHWSSHEGNLHYICPLCDTDLENEASFKKHLETQTEEEEALKECKICSESIEVPCLLNQHIKKKHGGQKVSDPSKKVSDPSTKVNTDTDSNGNDELNNNFECLVCSATFSRRSDLNFHETLEKHRRWKCPLCPKLLTDFRHLQDHLRCMHCDARIFKCTDCDMSFKVRRELNYHKVIHLKKSVMSKYQCSECSKILKKPRELLQHMANHHGGDRPFKCHLCPKTWPTPPDLRQHMLSHTDERPFPCSLCEKAFKSRTERNRHFKFNCPNNPNAAGNPPRKNPSVKKKKPKLVVQVGAKPKPKSTIHNVELIDKVKLENPDLGAVMEEKHVDLKVKVEQEFLDLDAVQEEENVDVKVGLQENDTNNCALTSTVKEESIDLKDIKKENILG